MIKLSMEIIINSPKYGQKIILIDESDYHVIKEYNWCISKSEKNRLYVTSSVWKGNKLYLHRVIAGAKRHEIIDHKNGDPLDNRRDNLRVCSQAMNCHNQGLRSNSSTGFKGVHFYKSRQKFVAEITVNYKRISLGYFDNVNDAAYAYNTAAMQYFGDFAKLNVIGNPGRKLEK